MRYRPPENSPYRPVEPGFERLLIYAAVFFAPFLDFTTSMVFFTLSDAFFSAALIVLLLRGRLPSAPLGVLTWPWIASFVLVVGGLQVSSMMAGDMLRGMILLLQYSFCFIALPYILLGKSREEAFRLIYVLIAGVIVLDVHGILIFYLVGYTPDSAVVSGNNRLQSLAGTANQTACLNAIIFVVVLRLRLSGRVTLKMCAALGSIMITAIVLTSSNSGLIALAAGVLSFLVCSLRFRQMLMILPVLALPGIFLLAGGSNYLPPTFQKRVLNAVESGDVSEAGTFESRSALMAEAVDMINSHEISLIGIGADQFRLKSVQGAPVHNSFLSLWVEGGIASLAGWVLFCSMTFILWCIARSRGVTPLRRAAVLASFVAFLVVANVSPQIYARYWYATLLLIMQPTLIALNAPSRSARHFPRNSPSAHSRFGTFA